MNDAKPSKSARKRDHLALQSLGEKLIPLELAELEKLHLDEPLLDAVMHAKSIRSRSAMRRQRQLIGKLMRHADTDSIQSSLENLGRQHRLSRKLFRDAEQWRDRIAAEGALAVAEFTALTGNAATNLENLLLDLDAGGSEAAQRSVRRRLFREVYKALESTTQPGQK